MTAFEILVVDLLVGIQVTELVRLGITFVRWIKRDWRRKEKDE